MNQRHVAHIIVVFLILLTGTQQANAQDGRVDTAGVVLFPAGQHITPFVANGAEAKVGLVKDVTTQRMRVDIGNSIDIVALHPGGGTTITLGIDFFADAFVIGAQGLHLQIDAIDGFFGGNCSFSTSPAPHRLQARLRILHHSAHLVDGNYDLQLREWIRPGGPTPFTRDFGEIIVAYLCTAEQVRMRLYAGMSHAALSRPAFLKREAFLGGIEVSTDRILPDIGPHPVTVYAAYQWDTFGTPEFRSSHQIEAGLKIGKWDGKGIRLFGSFRNGRHPFAEYITDDLTLAGAGFAVDFP